MLTKLPTILNAVKFVKELNIFNKKKPLPELDKTVTETLETQEGTGETKIEKPKRKKSKVILWTISIGFLIVLTFILYGLMTKSYEIPKEIYSIIGLLLSLMGG